MRNYSPQLNLLAKSAVVSLAASLIAGCTSTNVTNLTPSTQTRNPSGNYAVEAAWSSNQKSIRKDTLTPSVVIGLNSYPMRPVPMVKNRWEGLIPVPADTDIIHYRIKFDFQYDGVPVRRDNSRLSAPAQLRIVDQ